MKRVSLFLLLIALGTVGAGCDPLTTQKNNGAPIGPQVWLDAPLDGSTLPLAPVEIVSHSTDSTNAITQVELSVNGAVVRTDPNPDSAKAMLTTRQAWSPATQGNYTLLVRAQNAAGGWSDYARAVVTIGGQNTGGIVQGVIYTDLNGNGLPNDPGDAPMDGVVVTLSGCASRTTTTVNGTFQFTGLPTGTCLVELSKAGWKFSGTYPPGIGYPAKAVSDPTKPTAFALFMTSLATPTLSPTPKPGSSSTSSLPPVSIAFFADQLTLVAGQCTTLHWQVTNASQVLVDNATVAASGSKQDCPAQTTTHSMRVATLDNQTVQRSLTINVTQPAKVPPSSSNSNRSSSSSAPPPIIIVRPTPSPSVTATPIRMIFPTMPLRQFSTNTPTRTLIPPPR